ncbi:MAG: hypothetical protein H6Q39_1741, partial [Chloroflexi bacterium]|nr:hypothetical protein [Chloroflexota bacterium]
MKEENKTKDQLEDELTALRRRIIDMELMAAENMRLAQAAALDSEKRIRRIAEYASQLKQEITKRQQAEAELYAERKRLFSV